MSLARVPLWEFLSRAKLVLEHASIHRTEVNLVIGNQSADLDSICSTILFAYIRTYCKPLENDQSPTYYVPIANVRECDVKLKTELVPVLKRANLKASDLITLSHLRYQTRESTAREDTTDTLVPRKTTWYLIDHNKLEEPFERYKSQVVGCIDHHDDAQTIPKGSEPRVIEVCGSCASLVIRYCRSAWDTLLNKNPASETKALDCEIASLALAPILSDTQNLKGIPTTDTDKEAVKYLLDILGENYDLQKYATDIDVAKKALDDLRLEEILRKDYKVWTSGTLRIGISAAPRSIRYIFDRVGTCDAFLSIVKKFAEARNLSVVSVMTSYDADEGEGMGKLKELFIWGLDKHGAAVVDNFEKKNQASLELETKLQTSFGVKKEWYQILGGGSKWSARRASFREDTITLQHADPGSSELASHTAQSHSCRVSHTGEISDARDPAPDSESFETTEGTLLDHIGTTDNRRYWQQGNLSLTRKKIGPMMEKAAEAYCEPHKL